MKNAYRTATAAGFLLLSVPIPTEAQTTRIRPIAAWADGRQTLHVEVRDGSVHVRARGIVQAVSTVATPGEARLWADSVRALIRRALRPEPGERLEAETSTDALEYHMRMRRISDGSTNRYRLEMHDLDADQSVFFSMGRERVLSFLTAVEDAARGGDRMRGVLPAIPGDSADALPTLTQEAKRQVAASLGDEYVMSPLMLEVVVEPSGSVDSTSAYVLGRDRSRFLLEPLVHRLTFTRPTIHGRPARVRVRLPLAAVGGRETRPDAPERQVVVSVFPTLENRDEISVQLTRMSRSLRRAGITVGEVHARFLVDEVGRPDVSTLEILESPVQPVREAVVQLVARMQFLPAVAGGRQVRAWVNLPINFEAH